MLGRFRVLIGLLIVSPTFTACSPSLQAGQGNGLPWWVWVLIIVVLIIVVLVALVIWWWLRRRAGREAIPTARAKAVASAHVGQAPARVTEAPARVAEPRAPVAAPESPTPDNLRRVEGIGPKISSVFQAAGIQTFAQLAATDVSRLREILTEAGLSRLADPTTWPEQAHLAAAGDWDALEALQAELKGGRRV